MGLTPSATREFIQQGHRVLVQADAGAGSGFRNEQYRDAGCELVTSASDVFAQSDMIVKVKEPLPPEYKMVRENQVRRVSIAAQSLRVERQAGWTRCTIAHSLTP